MKFIHHAGRFISNGFSMRGIRLRRRLARMQRLMKKRAEFSGLRWPGRLLVGLGCLFVLNDIARSQNEPSASSQMLRLQPAIQYALENNPSLAAQRQQHGIAAAKVVIADTYPFNPVLENRIQGASGPPGAGVTNNVPIEHVLLWEFEVRHQRRYRRQGAAAALSRTDWEIAFQEQTLAVQVIRAYAAMLYRQEKSKLADETLRFNQRLVEDVRRLVNAGKLRNADLVIAQTEVTDTLDQRTASRELLIAARQDLLRVLGVIVGDFDVEGPLDPPAQNWDPDLLSELAIARRADLQAKRLALDEASANLNLAFANRRGNPTLGPAFGYDPSKITTIGVQINFPIPLPNRHRGEILQGEAEQAQAILLLRQAEVNIRQDVASALARLEAAERRADLFRTKTLPDLRRAAEDMEKLFQAGEPGLDLLRVIDVRRKLLKARDSYLDALNSVRQAQADLLAATGEPVLALCSPAATPAPANPMSR
jgi:outer membrane protein TolC